MHHIFGGEPNSYKELVAEIAQLRRLLEANTAELRELNDRLAEREARLAERDARVAELERLLAESRRSGKRQAAPFSKGDPRKEPAKPGRRSGEAHGRHGHRMAPTGLVDRELEAPLPSCCPDCGGELELESLAEQFQVDLGEMRPVTTRFSVPIGRCNNCNKRCRLAIASRPPLPLGQPARGSAQWPKAGLPGSITASG